MEDADLYILDTLTNQIITQIMQLILSYHYGHYLGKRSADAEPTAEADPAVVYQGVTGVYGVGLPGHLGNLGHYGQFGAGHLGHVGHLGYTIAKPTPVSAEVRFSNKEFLLSCINFQT